MAEPIWMTLERIRAAGGGRVDRATLAATGLMATISTKGQVILPKAIRDQLQWDAATCLTVEHTAGSVFLKPLTTVFAQTRPEDDFGCLPYKGRQPKPIEEMEIAMKAKRRHAWGNASPPTTYPKTMSNVPANAPTSTPSAASNATVTVA